jgi:hypothetical protein
VRTCNTVALNEWVTWINVFHSVLNIEITGSVMIPLHKWRMRQLFFGVITDSIEFQF